MGLVLYRFFVFLLCLSSLAPLGAVTDTISQNFNGTTIPAGDTIWFSANVQLTGNLPSAPVNIYAVDGVISFTANSQVYNIAVPNGTITFNPSTTTASTSFTDSQWSTVAKTSSTNTFLVGVQFAVPAGGLPKNIKNVSFTVGFMSDTPGITLNWKWGAAVYTQFNTYDNIGVWPTNSNGMQPGTPTNELKFLTGGATGGGGSNYTGSFSSSSSITPDVVMAPEPETWLILASTLALGAFLQYRRRTHRKPI